MENLKRELNLLYELGTLRLVDRTWKQFHLATGANVAEHSFRVQIIALLIAKMEGIKDANVLARIALMALFHDVAETRTGDTAFVSSEYTKRDEQMAVNDMFTGSLIGEFILPIWKEAEQKQTLEAKIVKDADYLDVDLELKEKEYQGLKAVEIFWETRKYLYENKLNTISAKKLWEEIQNSNPVDWVLKARNRINNGQWSIKK